MENRPIIVANPNPRDRVEPGERYVLDTLSISPLKGWTIYEQPNLNGDKPDIVMVHPRRGVIIIEIKDYQLNSCNYKPVAQLLGDDGEWVQRANPVDQVCRYRDEIQQFCSSYFVDLLEEHNQERYVFGIIETVVYFHHASAEVGRSFCGNPSPRKVKILDRTHFEAMKRGDWANSGLFTISQPKSFKFSYAQLERFVSDLETWLKPSSYQMEGARPITLMPDQKAQAKPTPKLHRRLRGVAGSGKTLVLATRAAKLLEEDFRVLAVPFNITLKHYLRDSISRQFTGYNKSNLRKNLVIRHFHDVLKMIAFHYDIKLENPHYDTDYVLTNIWHAQVMECLKGLNEIDENLRFDAILVDEGQDYCQGWVELLLLLLKERDEFLITYDNKQDIYDRQAVWIEDGKQVEGLGFRGKPAQLSITRRIPATMVKVSQEFAEKFKLLQGDDILVPTEGDDLFVTLQWKNKGNSFSPAKPESDLVWEQVSKFIGNGVSPDDITILTTNQDTGLEIVQKLKSQKMKVCHVFDESGEKDYKKRRKQKWKFQPGTGKIKVSTVHSFKGWESTHPILVLDEKADNTPSLIYVALTRFKHPRDGAESHFVCLNFDSEYDSVKSIFDKHSNNPVQDDDENDDWDNPFKNGPRNNQTILFRPIGLSKPLENVSFDEEEDENPFEVVKPAKPDTFDDSLDYNPFNDTEPTKSDPFTGVPNFKSLGNLKPIEPSPFDDDLDDNPFEGTKLTESDPFKGVPNFKTLGNFKPIGPDPFDDDLDLNPFEDSIPSKLERFKGVSNFKPSGEFMPIKPNPFNDDLDYNPFEDIKPTKPESFDDEANKKCKNTVKVKIKLKRKPS